MTHGGAGGNARRAPMPREPDEREGSFLGVKSSTWKTIGLAVLTLGIGTAALLVIGRGRKAGAEIKTENGAETETPVNPTISTTTAQRPQGGLFKRTIVSIGILATGAATLFGLKNLSPGTFNALTKTYTESNAESAPSYVSQHSAPVAPASETAAAAAAPAEEKKDYSALIAKCAGIEAGLQKALQAPNDAKLDRPWTELLESRLNGMQTALGLLKAGDLTPEKLNKVHEQLEKTFVSLTSMKNALKNAVSLDVIISDAFKAQKDLKSDISWRARTAPAPAQSPSPAPAR